MWATFERLPLPAQRSVKAVWRRLPSKRPKWGNLRRAQPFSSAFGIDRGTPIDRPFIESWLAERSDLIRGRVLEIKDSEYARRFGSNIESCDVLDIDATNTAATIIGDANVAGTLRREHYDCIIVTQTLQYLEPALALDNFYSALRPGGHLLISVPSASGIDPFLVETDYYRWTPAGLRHVLLSLDGAHVSVEGRGNLLVLVGYLYGLATEELREAERQFVDTRYPLLAFATVQKPRRDRRVLPA
jgi:SAM-dependent methyltransferase